MNYKESVRYLESFWKFGIKLGLSRITHLLHLLGNPQKRFKSIHVAGTNGKGSVCVMTASVLEEAGYKTGLYTSPHLLEYTERIKVNGRDISHAKFSRLIAKIKKIIDEKYSLKELPTEFELLTAAAFLFFAEEKADIAVIETGLGGRLDSTNVLMPVVCAITNIDLDHCSILGKTLSSIAKEKAGIIKRGVPVITACDKPAALKVIRERCKKQRAKLVACARKDADVIVEHLGSNAKGQMVNMFSLGKDIRGLFIPFLGAHQAVNAAVAAGVLMELQRKKFHISGNAFRRGFSCAKWPARSQVVRRRPLTIIDGAHNPSGVRALFKALAGSAKKDIIAVVGILKDKDYPAMIKEACRHCKLIIAVSADNPRSCPAGIIASLALKRKVRSVIAGSPAEGLRLATKMAGDRDRICVFGSLYTCAEVLREA